jgi:hypothetical protein
VPRIPTRRRCSPSTSALALAWAGPRTASTSALACSCSLAMRSRLPLSVRPLSPRTAARSGSHEHVAPRRADPRRGRRPLPRGLGGSRGDRRRARSIRRWSCPERRWPGRRTGRAGWARPDRYGRTGGHVRRLPADRAWSAGRVRPFRAAAGPRLTMSIPLLVADDQPVVRAGFQTAAGRSRRGRPAAVLAGVKPKPCRWPTASHDTSCGRRPEAATGTPEEQSADQDPPNRSLYGLRGLPPGVPGDGRRDVPSGDDRCATLDVEGEVGGSRRQCPSSTHPALVSELMTAEVRRAPPAGRVDRLSRR